MYIIKIWYIKKSNPEGSVVVLRMGNLQNGEIDWSNLMYTDDKDDIEKYLLKKVMYYLIVQIVLNL